MRTRINRNKVIELNSLGYTDLEISRMLSCSENGVKYIRRDVLKLPKNKRNYKINSIQIEIIVGTLLGDAWLGYVHKQCISPKLQISHSSAQKLYTEHLHKELSSIMLPTVLIIPGKFDYICGKKCYKKDTISISSHNCECLIPIHKAFYPNGKKIIPINFLKKHFTARSLAYWYMDDGSYDKRTNSFIFNTQSFSRENLQEFILYLKEQFSLSFTIKKDRTLYLRHLSNQTFVSLIQQYLTNDMLYKIGSSLNSVKQGTS